MRDNAELRKLAVDMVEGHVFGTWALKADPQMITLVFMPLALMSSEEFERVRQYAHLYEYISESGDRGINGYPCFFSFRGITHEEWAALTPLLEELVSAKQAFLEDKN